MADALAERRLLEIDYCDRQGVLTRRAVEPVGFVEIFADRPSRVETMTGLTSDQVDRLVLDVHVRADLDPARRRVVGPYRTVLIVLLYLRHNLSQALLAELFGCSQPTVSRLISRLTPMITIVLTPNAEQVAERELRSTVRIDGFLAPTGDRRKDTYTSGMYSGKAPRLRIQHPGRRLLARHPRHDRKAHARLDERRQSLARIRLGPTIRRSATHRRWSRRLRRHAYTGTGLCIPLRKPKGQTPTQSARGYNRMIASRRANIERVIAT
ncbi:helix-turn-helix domain-containing protein [Allorhizocola rhizosphaerae]|uniref:helix-turn-helix domain-containing protein n=1 Tax=Allorhizocola rhizosphaerae TaxID=1872709 RepID=UPI001FE3D504|nr:transposase family protein [Allorhizocola rhizosphaerae]